MQEKLHEILSLFLPQFLTISSNLALLQLPNEKVYLVPQGVNSPNKKWPEPFVALIFKKRRQALHEILNPRGTVCRGCFSNSIPYFVVFTSQIIYQYSNSGSTRGKLNLTRPLKPLNH